MRDPEYEAQRRIADAANAKSALIRAALIALLVALAAALGMAAFGWFSIAPESRGLLIIGIPGCFVAGVVVAVGISMAGRSQ